MSTPIDYCDIGNQVAKNADETRDYFLNNH